METLNMYQIPRSIMHDPLQNHVAHHFVTFSLDRLLLPIDMTEFTPSLPSLYAQLPLHALCMLTRPLFAPLLSCTLSCRHWLAIDCSVWSLWLPALYDCSVWSLHCRHWSIHQLRPWYDHQLWPLIALYDRSSIVRSIAAIAHSVAATDRPQLRSSTPSSIAATDKSVS